MHWSWRKDIDVDEYRKNMRKYDSTWFKAKYIRSQLGFVVKALNGLPGMLFFLYGYIVFI